MPELILSIAAFTALHIIPSTRLRPWIIARFGRTAFMILLSVLSAISFIWMWFAYKAATHHVETIFWVTHTPLRIFSAAIMYIAILLAVWMVTNSPRVLINGEHLLQDENSIRGVLRITRHPMMWPLALWAMVHMLNNADPAGFVYFGYFTFLALFGTVMIDKRRKQHLPQRWANIESSSSNIPFGAILSSRNHFSWAEMGWLRPLAALIIWAAIIHFHADFTGFPIF